jgi:hypothetical protein
MTVLSLWAVPPSTLRLGGASPQILWWPSLRGTHDGRGAVVAGSSCSPQAASATTLARTATERLTRNTWPSYGRPQRSGPEREPGVADHQNPLVGVGDYRKAAKMKVEATVALKFQARSLSEAGAILDDVLARAGDRDDVDVGPVTVTTPPGATPVSLPAVSPQGGYSPGVPHPTRA